MRERSGIFQSLVRAAVLLAWALVVWGGLLVVSAVANAITEGPEAFARLLPASDASFWGWLGPVSVLLAVTAAFGGGLLFNAMRPRVSRVRRPPDRG